jgi:magnesium transporter
MTSLAAAPPLPDRAAWKLYGGPTDEELGALVATGIPSELLSHVRDPDERPRVAREGDIVLIVLHFPFRQTGAAAVPYISLPLTILLTKTNVVMIAPVASAALEHLVARENSGLAGASRTRLILHLMFGVAAEYLVCLREINEAVEELEELLRRSLRNEEVLELLRYEKSLVYFTTSLASNEMLLERLQRGHVFDWPVEDVELLEDVLIEVRQAMAMVDISSNILSQMMDAFASIVSNNLNVVMKVLTSMTIILAVPSLIATLYGMNVRLPGAGHVYAFAGIVGLSIVVTLALVAIFIREKWL